MPCRPPTVVSVWSCARWTRCSLPLTVKSMRTLCPGVRLGHGLRHAFNKLPKKLAAIASPVRQALRPPFHPWWYLARPRKSLRGFALGQR